MSELVLNAVNEMLLSIGESPVTTLDSGLLEAKTALQILDRESTRIQSIGYPFNTEENFPLIRDIEGIIYLPENTLRVESKAIANGEIKVRGNRLYNAKERSFLFSSTINVDLILKLLFDELPESGRTYITLKAARIFQDRLIGDGNVHGYQQNDEEMARYYFLQEVDTKKYNIFDGPLQRELWRYI
ncbi:hypothetical protein [Zooshikella sp. RANM57]|uniref:hypothetical protein n=1 Tax=Zooshikella sp. RANM57 TaxID=3425863 RepID=UPI003D6F8F26